MYLLDWSGYDDEDRLEWVPASKLNNFTSLNSGLEGEYVTVWWGNGKDATLTEQSKSYKGEIVDSEEIDECESDDDEQRPTTQEYEFIISYEDGDTEILNAKTLAFKQLQSVDSRKQVHRVAWILKKQDSDNIRADVMRLCVTQRHEHQERTSNMLNKEVMVGRLHRRMMRRSFVVIMVRQVVLIMMEQS